MPLFDYRCEECGHITEYLERADADGEHVCEACGSSKLTRQLSICSVQMSQGSQPAGGSSCSICGPSGGCSSGACGLG